jgi:hypothetical protein
VTALEDLFPDEDYRFHLTLRKGDLAEFFTAPDAAALAERRRWLTDDSDRCVAFLPAAEPLLAELEHLATVWGARVRERTGSGAERLAWISREFVPDVLLLPRGEANAFTLAAGAVCFPSWWSLAEKIGRSLDEIHGPVPGLNPALGGTINQFLARLRPGAAYCRVNWGLTATPELNLHPNRARPRLDSVRNSTHAFLRTEEQIVAALPVSGGVLFGIRIRLNPLADVLSRPALRAGFHRALRTMPDDLIAYKGLAGVRAAWLAASAPS